MEPGAHITGVTCPSTRFTVFCAQLYGHREDTAMKSFMLLVALVIGATVPAFGQLAPADPGNDTGAGVQRACSTALEVNYLHPRKTKTHRESFDLGYCLGLIKGVYENLNGEVDFCPADNVSLRQITEVTLDFVKAHPELKDRDSADIVRWALTDGFPCHSTNAKSDTAASTEKH
jgi:Rap1a immunity proteins